DQLYSCTIRSSTADSRHLNDLLARSSADGQRIGGGDVRVSCKLDVRRACEGSCGERGLRCGFADCSDSGLLILAAEIDADLLAFGKSGGAGNREIAGPGRKCEPWAGGYWDKHRGLRRRWSSYRFNGAGFAIDIDLLPWREIMGVTHVDRLCSGCCRGC